MKKLIITFGFLCACAWATVTPASVSPSSGSGLTQQFTFTYTSTNGPSDIATMSASFVAGSYNGAQAGPCRVVGSTQTGLVQLYTDSGSIIGGYLGTNGTLSNSHCSINLLASWQYASGTQAWFAPAMTFSASYPGPINLYSNIMDIHAQNGPWMDMGDWTVPGAASPPTVSLTSPTLGGTGSAQRFVLTATGSDQGWTSLQITPGGPGWAGWSIANSCIFLFYPDGTTYIGNNAFSGFNPPSVLGPGGSVISNSQCSANTSTGQTSVTGTTRTYVIDVTFTPAYAGTKNVSALSATSGGVYNTPVTFGSWTVPSGGGGMRKGDSVVTQNIDDTHPQYGISALTGNPVLMPTSLHPLVSLNLSTASQDNPDFLAVNTPFTITVRHSKPNQPVYIWEDDDDDPGVAQGAHTTGGYVGSTDNAGNIAWDTNVLPNYTGYRTYFIYVGNWGGPSTGPIPDEFYVGALVLWATGANGLPAFPSFTQ